MGEWPPCATFLPGTERASLITDPRTLFFAGAVALGVGLLIGLAPMVQVTRGNLTGDLKSGAREGTYQRERLRTALVLLQCALSVMLLVGAGLFVRSLRNVRDVRLGFDADSVLVVTLNMRDVRLDSAATVALRLRLLESAKGCRGLVRDAAGVDSVRRHVVVADLRQWHRFGARPGRVYFKRCRADYFKTMGTRIVRGRAIEART